MRLILYYTDGRHELLDSTDAETTDSEFEQSLRLTDSDYATNEHRTRDFSLRDVFKMEVIL